MIIKIISGQKLFAGCQTISGLCQATIRMLLAGSQHNPCDPIRSRLYLGKLFLQLFAQLLALAKLLFLHTALLLQLSALLPQSVYGCACRVGSSRCSLQLLSGKSLFFSCMSDIHRYWHTHPENEVLLCLLSSFIAVALHITFQYRSLLEGDSAWPALRV